MPIINRISGKKVRFEIIEISKSELVNILDKNNFGFDWLQEVSFDLYALRLIDNDQIIGLMALKDIQEELRIEIILLESSKENIGHSKVYENIAGCLIAWACRLAFINGYFGFVSLIPKTRLIPHYISAYGLKQFGGQLAVDTDQSLRLIKKYLTNE